jgi:bifunctional UDP-N-acetylglucosamine pyrophosphorylase/glucosamine-1-phosphate N-acetyltransferase
MNHENPTRTCLAILLAAGEGTRMRSSLPKVLHRIGSRTLLAHGLDAVRLAGGSEVAVVVAPDRKAVGAEACAHSSNAQIFEQAERRGTAHAVSMARQAIEKGADDVLVLFADTPLVRAQTLQAMRAPLANGAAVVVLAFRPANPAGYGRVVMQGNEAIAIREENDASDQEKRITLCNGGLMALAGKHALAILDRIKNDNRKKEFYLTDAVAIAREMGLATAVVEAEEDDVRGINNKAQLAEAEAVLQKRLRLAAMEAGVTLVAPETVYLAADTKFGSDVTVEPHVVFGEGVSVGDGATIHSFSHIAGAKIGKGVSVGPFARLRPGTELGDKSRVGNFVEVKAAVFEAGAKANHLTYIGDARVGEGANVGAGTITCNYDGAGKHITDIGKGAFIGSNSALVAPVKIGDGAYVGSGSVVTKDVPADALAIGRARQVNKDGYGKRIRALNEASKAAKKTDKTPG